MPVPTGTIWRADATGNPEVLKAAGVFSKFFCNKLELGLVTKTSFA